MEDFRYSIGGFTCDSQRDRRSALVRDERS
jgi:hypothetical protein